jgi:hypothetical protein
MKNIFIRSITQNLLLNTIEIQCMCRASFIGGEAFVLQNVSFSQQEIEEFSITSIVGMVGIKLGVDTTEIGSIAELTQEELEKIKTPLSTIRVI